MSMVEIIDVTPRDGLQNEKAIVSTEHKVELITRLIEAGARRLEVASFVSPRHVPQMADAREVVAALPSRTDVKYVALAVNQRGVEDALNSGIDEVNFVVPLTDDFARANQNTTVDDAITVAIHAAELAVEAETAFTVSFAVAFGCPFAGEVSIEHVLRSVRRILDHAVVSEIALADTIGCADPWQVSAMFEHLADMTDVPLRAHFHETRHTALANTAAALSQGVRRFDSSVGGLGGCPFAPGAAGNVSTEDLAWMLGRGGYDHGFDLDQAIDAGRWICELVGVEPRSGLSYAGVFPGTR